MEPCRTAVRAPRRSPFAVLPFLYYYETEELSRFMRTHLDPPFNERFSEFIQAVGMRGIQYVRMSREELERLCEGEGDHLYDLETFQKARYKPQSPHVRDIFALPDMTFAPQVAPDIFGDYTAELNFDYPDEDLVQPVVECLVPLPLTPVHAPSKELPPAEEVALSSPLYYYASSSDADEEYDEDSLIDMFSPASPSMGLPFDSARSEGSLSPAFTDPDVFDEEHLESLCSPITSPVVEDNEVVDILGLLRHEEEPVKKTGSRASPGFDDAELGDKSDIYCSDATELREDDVISLSATAEHLPVNDRFLSLRPTLRVAVAEAYFSASLFQVPHYSPSLDEGSLILIEDGTEERSSPSEHDPPHPSRDVVLHPHATSHIISPDSVLPTRLALPAADVTHELTYEDDDHEVDIDDLRTVDGPGLSSFMPDLRSLDSTPPPPLSPHMDTASACDELSQGFSDSPDLTSLHTPIVSVFHDDALVASPTTSYRGTHDHLPDFFFNPERIVAKKLDFSLPQEDTVWPQEASNAATIRRPILEVAIPLLPSLLEDEQLTSLMSSIELTRAASQGSLSSFTPPPPIFALSRSSSTGSDRSIWPVPTLASRYLPSPHMKEPRMSPRRRDDEDTSEMSAPSRPSQQSESGESSSDHSSEVDKAQDDRPGCPASSLSDISPSTLSPSSLGQSQSSASAWGKVGGFLRTILSPLEVDDSAERPSLPGGLSS